MPSDTQIGDYNATRTNLFTIEPQAIKVDWSRNWSRNGEEPPVDDDLINLARDMMPREAGGSGQISPITLRVNEQGEREVVMGFRRLRAALWLVESGECPDFRIRFIVAALDEREAALVNLSENLQRKDPQPIQTAHALKRLRDELHFTLEEIAARMKRSTTWASNLLRLVTLPEEIQEKVAEGELGVTAAVELSKISGEDAQISTYRELAEDDNVTASSVREKNPDRKDKAAKGPLNKLRKFLERKHMDNEGGASLAEMLLEWLDGDQDDRTIDAYWDDTFRMLTEQLAER
jgi:ParB/RepB/Spo0J family partition protein